MILKPVTLEHGERYGKLTVLAKIKTQNGVRYRVGCTCGNSHELYRASDLMKGRVTACRLCRTGKR